ncbi:MAG TPA: hypothetical protein VKZ84_03410 [Bacteriovoracaceae bacterium]|nr:hypothetical protein [Bacteriovoracaceae bacterium]
MIWPFILLLSSWVNAQDFNFLLTPGGPTTYLTFENQTQPKESDTKVLNQRFMLGHTVKTEKLDYVVGTNYQHLDFDNKSSSLRDYSQYQLSLGVRKNLSHNKFWFANVSYGSASDRPFKNADDDTISANYIRKTSDRWVMVVNYSNNRSFLNNIPLPGFFYIKDMTRQKTTIIGFPFLLLMRNVGDWSYRYLGLLPWRHQARVSYSKFSKVHPYVGFEQEVFNFFRHDREKSNQRTFFFQRRLGVGADFKLVTQLKLDLFLGHSFDREIFEARNFSDKKSSKTRFDDSFFIETKVSYSF